MKSADHKPAPESVQTDWVWQRADEAAAREQMEMLQKTGGAAYRRGKQQYLRRKKRGERWKIGSKRYTVP